MMLIQVPDSLASDLCSHDGCRIVQPTQSNAMDVVLAVLAAGGNIVTLIATPEGIKANLETIRSWVRHHAPERSVEVQSSSVDGQVFIRDEADLKTAIAVIRVTFDLL